MTIDEAIAKYKEIANTDANCPAHCNISCDKCVQESKQLAEWLEELKILKSLKNCSFMTIGKTVEQFEQEIRCKAIDDFVEAIDKEDREEPLVLDMCKIEEIAEKLKVGDRE